MEPMFAVQLCNFIAKQYLIHANTALSLAIVTQHLLCDIYLRQVRHSLRTSRTRCIASCILFHQLRDDAIKRLLCVDCIAVLSNSRIEDRGDERREGIWGRVRATRFMEAATRSSAI